MTRSPSALSGFLNVYKPVGPGSQSLLGAIRRVAGTRRVGHGGTLDPFASGVLPVAIGRSTRLIERLHSHPKSYVAQLRLGLATSTCDVEGEVTEERPVPALTLSEIESALAGFVGEIEQVPPAYSAARVSGRRAYELARSGGDVALRPRRVHIHDLRLVEWSGGRLVFEVTCSSGTYVRSLGADIARSLGTVGYLARLTRTRVGPFDLAGTWTLDEVRRAGSPESLARLLVPPDVLLYDLPALPLSPDESSRLLSGGFTPREGASPPRGRLLRAYTPDGELLGLVESTEPGLEMRLLLK